jgi:citrate synthase
MNQKLKEFFSENPKAPKYFPVDEAITLAEGLGEERIASALKNFKTMPQSTAVIANPVTDNLSVKLKDDDIILDIRSFTIRGILHESDIVKRKFTPAGIVFILLFGRFPEKTAEGSEEASFAAYLDDLFYSKVSDANKNGGGSLIEQIAGFVSAHPSAGPEIAIQYFAALRKAFSSDSAQQYQGVNEEIPSGELLHEMISVHIENIAVGTIAAYMNRLLEEDSNLQKNDLVAQVEDFIDSEKTKKSSVFDVSYGLILGNHVNERQKEILEIMGVIQTHHGSAGSNIVARYLATLHTMSVSDLFSAAQMALDGARHFGAIHDMTHFINKLDDLDNDEREKLVRSRLIVGDLPTFGHPEISAAGRGDRIQQDPRAAIYLSPLFSALDSGDIVIKDEHLERLEIAKQIYRIALIEGVVKPGKENAPPLRLTPNTDFGAWCVQEALGILESHRTLLTYVFRGFGWMVDVREQLQLKIIRPVISPAPEIIPPKSTEAAISEVVNNVHNRLSGEQPFIKQESRANYN